MDEHIQLLEGKSVEFEHDFCDENIHDVSWFCHKHVDYAAREAVDMLDIELNLRFAVRRMNPFANRQKFRVECIIPMTTSGRFVRTEEKPFDRRMGRQ